MKLRTALWKRLSSSRGQTLSEYLLVISVLVVGAVAVTYSPMADAFRDGSKGYKTKVQNATADGHFEGSSEEQR